MRIEMESCFIESPEASVPRCRKWSYHFNDSPKRGISPTIFGIGRVLPGLRCRGPDGGGYKVAGIEFHGMPKAPSH